MVTLNQYLRDSGMTQEDFAAAIKVTQATVSRLCRGKAQPSKELMLTIEKETAGAVPVLSWFAAPAGEQA